MGLYEGGYNVGSDGGGNDGKLHMFLLELPAQDSERIEEG